MNPRLKKIIAILIIAIVLLLLLWLLLFREKPEVTPDVTVPTDQEVIIPSEPSKADLKFGEEIKERSQTADVVALSKTFVERYGSYSNESNFENLRDVMPIMTTAFAAETQTLIDSLSASSSYYGVTSRVLTVNVETRDDVAGIASISVTTQRQEAVDSPKNVEVKYQDILLEMRLVGGEWKVSSARWQ